MGVGIDEAGRGPVIGPLVICALFAQDTKGLKDAGVKDSKRLDPSERERIYDLISGLPRSVIIIPAESIDSARDHMSLNDLEVYGFASTLVSLAEGSPRLHPRIPQDCTMEVKGRSPPCKVWMDAADVDESRFTERVRLESANMGISPFFNLEGHHKADSTYLEVSGASIVAKVRRDALVESISEDIGEDVGSGYPGDPVTIVFLERYVKETGSLPPHTRKSWDTARSIMGRRANRSLTDY
jgi:ribonuclease HII